jgi:hypothetical protein
MKQSVDFKGDLINLSRRRVEKIKIVLRKNVLENEIS